LEEKENKTNTYEQMKSWLKALGAFIYTSIVCGLYLLASAFLLKRFILRAEGFWMVVSAIFFILVFFGWLSEKGVKYASIPYNFLWDNTKKTRLATSIPALLLWLYGVVLPFLFPYTFSFSDWLIVVVWEITTFFFFYNMFTLPIINPEIGKQS